MPELALDDVRNLVDVAVRDRPGVRRLAVLAARAAALPGRNGVTVLEGILAEREGKGRTESWLERAFLGLARSGPGSRSRRCSNAWPLQGRPIARVDFLYEPKLVIEVSGYASHSTRTAAAG